MRTSNIVQTNQTSQEVGTNAIAMSIDEASNVFLMDALGKLYSRPAQAALREYLSNAIDAHKAKGGTLPPIQITLPTKAGMNAKLSIRDFGKGMTEEEFSTILSRYGASTKRDSNAMIGGFGLGAKSGFAVSNEFFMTSYQNGQAIRVRIFKDSLNQGYIEVTDRFSTKEDDGMLVELPIPNGNLYELNKTALFNDFPFFMGYGVDAIDISPSSDQFAKQSVHNNKVFTPLTFGSETLGWVAKKQSNDSKMFALIGKVAYPIDLNRFSKLSRENNVVNEALVANVLMLKKFQRIKVINLPIGSVDLPSSREEITYSERSIRTIGAAISNYALMVKEQIQKELNTKKTKQLALANLADLEASSFSDVTDLTWQGKPIGIASLKDSIALAVSLRLTPKNYSMGVSIDLSQAVVKRISKFRELNGLSSKSDFNKGIFRITVKDSREMAAVKRLLTKKVVLDFLKIDTNDTTLSRSYGAMFMLTIADDSVNEWTFNHTDVDSVEFEKIIQKHKEEYLAEQVAEKVLQAKKVEEAKKKELAKEERALGMLSNFVVSSSPANTLSRNKANIVFKDEKVKKFFWAEEEVIAFIKSSIQSRKQKAIEANLLFPFTATKISNTFDIVTTNGGWNSTSSHLTKLRAFLNYFFEENSKMIVIGKERNLEEFKTAYPTVVSGVTVMQETIEAQTKDAKSELMIAFLALGNEKYHSNQTEVRSLMNLYKTLGSKKKELPEDLLTFAERFKAIEDSVSRTSRSSAVDERYMNNIVKHFIPEDAAQAQSYSVMDDLMTLKSTYPLLINSNFNHFSPAVVNDLLAYVKMCEQRAV